MHYSILLMTCALALSCSGNKNEGGERAPDDTASDSDPVHDSPQPDDTDDTGDSAAPAACGSGTWGELETDESTVYVDIAAAEGGDGSQGAPFTSIQAGLDAAGDAGGGMVAVAAGTYAETLKLGPAQIGVHLAGRCRELVVIDASVGDEWTPGIEVNVLTAEPEPEVSGVTVSGSHAEGMLIASGTVTIRDSSVVGSENRGVVVYKDWLGDTALTMESCELSDNAAIGVLVGETGTTATLRQVVVRGTEPDEYGDYGYGLSAYGGATLHAESCEVSGSTAAGVLIGEPDTTVSLHDTNILDTRPAENGSGFGIYAFTGASLETESCEVVGNAWSGVLATGPGTSVSLRETNILDTQPEERGEGFGILVQGGANLTAESSTISGSTAAGLIALEPDTSVTLFETTVQGTQPEESGQAGYGIVVQDGATLRAEDCDVSENTSIGIIASDISTAAALQDTTIASTRCGEVLTVGMGVAVQAGATIEATGLEVLSNEGPGLYVIGDQSTLNCSGCALQDNQFAGAVVVYGASLALDDAEIVGTIVQENLGGGVGVYSDPWYGAPPALSITDSTIRDNPVAGVWVSGQGTHSLSGNTIHGGEGWSRETLTKCGDAVFARDGTTPWDGSSGLLLEDNELLDGRGAGVFLHNASATLSGNSYQENAVDLVRQGADCDTPPEGYEDEVIGTAELCPFCDYATCGDEFILYLELVEPDAG